MALNNWLNRTTKQLILNTSPSDMGMAAPESDATWIYDPDLSAITGVLSKYWIITGDAVSEMSQAQKDAVDEAELTASRDLSIQVQIDDLETVLRQVVILTVGELNDLRQWIESYKTEVANASSLSDLQTRVAALPNMPDRQFSVVKTQLRNALGN